MSARIRGAQTELQELGEEEDQYTKSTSKMRESIKAMTGFDIMKDEAGTEFKDIYDIVVGIGEQWDKLNDITRASLLEMIGGKRGVNSLAAVMNNIDRVKEIYNTAINAEGSAMKENEAYQQSVQASIDKTKAQLQELAHDFLSSDLLKGLIDGARTFLGIIDQIVSSLGTVGTVIAGLGAGSWFKSSVLKQDSLVGDLFKDLISIGRNKSYPLDTLVSRGASDEKIIGKLKNMGGFDAAKEALEGVTGLDAEKKVDLIKGAFEGASVSAQEFADATVAANNSLTVTSKLSKGVGKIKDAFLGLIKTIVKHPVASIATGAAIGMVTLATIQKRQQEALRQQGIEGARSWESQKKSLESYTERYRTLQESLAGATSDEEALSIKMQLLDLQKEIVAQYGAQASGIDLVNGELNTELGIMQKISAEQAKINLRDYYKSYQQAVDKFDFSEVEIGLGEITDDVIREIEGIPEFKLDITSEDGFTNLGTLGFNEGINLYEARDAIDKFLSTDIGKQYDDEGFFKGIKDEIDSYIAEYGEQYDAFTEDIIAASNNSDVFNKLKEASSKLTEAALSADPKVVDEAKETYDQAYKEVENRIGKGVSYEYKDKNGRKQTGFAPESQFANYIKEAAQYDQAQLDFFYRSDILSGKNASETNPYKDRANDIKRWADIIKASGMDVADAELEIQKAMEIGSGTTSRFVPSLTEEQTALLNLRSALGIATDGTSEYLNVLSSTGVVLSSTEQQNNALADSFESTKSSIEESIKSLSALPAIVNEGLSGTGLSADNLQSFRAIFGDDAEKALERTANGIKINRDAFEALQRSYTTSKLAEFNKELQTQQDNLDEVNKKMREASNASELTQLKTDRSNAQNRINELKDLISMYEGATSAHNQWMQAQSIGEDRDLYESVFGAYDDYKKELDSGKWADDELRAYVGMMTGMKDVSLATAQEIRDAFNGMSKNLEGTSYSLMDFYNEADGTVTSKGVDNFLKAVHEKFGDEFAKQAKDGSWEFDFSPEHVEAIMDAWPIGQTPIDAIIAAMPDAGYRVNPDGAGKITSKQRAYDSKKYLESKLGDEYNLKDIEISALEGNKDAISDALKVFDGLLQGFGDLDLDKKGFDSIISNLSYLRELNGEYGLNAEENAAYQTIMGGYAEDARAYLQHHTGSDYKFSEINLDELDGNIDKIDSAIELTQRYLDNFGKTDPEGAENATVLMEQLTNLKTKYEESFGGYQTAMEEKRKGEELANKHAEEAGEETPKTFEESVTKGLGDTTTAISDAASDIGGKIDEANGILSEIAGRNNPNGGSNGKPKKPVAPLKTQEEEYQIPEYDPTWHLPKGGGTGGTTGFGPIDPNDPHNRITMGPMSLFENSGSGDEVIDAIEEATESVDKVGEETENRNSGEQTAMHEMQKQLEMNAAVEEARHQMLYNNNPVNDKFKTFQEKEESINAGVTGETGEGTGTEPGEINVNSAVVNVDKAEEQEGQGQTSESSTGYGGNGQPKPETDKGTYGIDAYGNPIQEDINQPPQDIHADAVNVITGEIGTATDGTGTSDEPTKQNEEYGEAVEDVGDLADDATGQVAGLGTALEGVTADATAILGGFGAAERDTANGAGIQRFIESNSPSAPSPTQQYETVEPQEQVVKIRVDSEEAVKGVRDLAQEIQDLDGETQASIGINTEEAQAAIENLASMSDTDIEAGVTINQEDLDVLESAIGAMSDDVKMQVGLDTAEVDQYIGDEHNTDGKVIFGPEDSAVQSYSAPTKSGTVYYSIAPMDWSSLDVPAQYKNQTITIHVNRVDNGGGGAPDSNGTGGVNGTAHASGTWGVKNDEDSLINEVGEEIIVNLFSDITWRHVLKTYLIAGKPLEPYVPQRNHEIWVGVMV